MTGERLKLLFLYHQIANEYRLMDHNQMPENAKNFISSWDNSLAPGSELIALDQKARHRTADAQRCKSCRRLVRESLSLEPPPRFKGRTP